MKPCLLFLSCKNIKEADKISGQLLKEKLIVCAKKIPINSSYLWKSKIESAQEVLLIMDSIEENFEKINHGKVFFPYQRVVMTVVIMLIISLTLNFIK